MTRLDRRVRAAAAIGALLVFGAMAYSLLRGGGFAFDQPVRAAIHGWASPALTAAMRLITSVGSEYFLVPLAVIPIWRWAKRGERSAAYLFAGGVLTAEAVLQLLKILIHRPRPEVFFGLAPTETYSFPSGHAFVPAVYFGILAVILGARAGWLAAVLVLAALLGFSRVYLGYHYPSDVIAGWSLAVLWLALGTILSNRHPASMT